MILAHRHVGEARRGLTRRQLLLRGAVASGGLLISGAAIRFAALLGQQPAQHREALTERESEILVPLIEALLPPGGEMPAGEAGFIIPRLDHYLAHTDGDARLLFRSMLHLVEDQSALFSLQRFSRCSLAERMAQVRVWELTPLYLKRMAFSSVKLFIGLQYFEQPGVHEAMGWYVGCAAEQLPQRKEGLG